MGEACGDSAFEDGERPIKLAGAGKGADLAVSGGRLIALSTGVGACRAVHALVAMRDRDGWSTSPRRISRRFRRFLRAREQLPVVLLGSTLPDVDNGLPQALEGPWEGRSRAPGSTSTGPGAFGLGGRESRGPCRQKDSDRVRP